jgi:hypothetical protein
LLISLQVEITNFVRLCGESVTGLKISDISSRSEVSYLKHFSPCSVSTLPLTSQVIISLENFMNEAKEWIADFPPLQQPMRFGNKAYRQWHERLQQRITSYLSILLSSFSSGPSSGIVTDTTAAVSSPSSSSSPLSHLSELAAYLSDSFGNERRIDYGTGHETNLVLFFLSLFKLHFLTRDDLPALVLRVFSSYLRTMRELQNIYFLEPAGSHGVWGLDDYHCLIYVWGAFQVCWNLVTTSSHSSLTVHSLSLCLSSRQAGGSRGDHTKECVRSAARDCIRQRIPLSGGHRVSPLLPIPPPTLLPLPSAQSIA